MKSFEDYSAEELRHVLRFHNIRPCAVPACNCRTGHQSHPLLDRVRELEDRLAEAGHPLSNDNGHRILGALEGLIEERDKLQEQRDAHNPYAHLNG